MNGGREPCFPSLREWWRRRRAAALHDKLEDAETHHRRFGFANYPSEERREVARIKRLRAKLARLHRHEDYDGPVDADGERWCGICQEWIPVTNSHSSPESSRG